MEASTIFRAIPTNDSTTNVSSFLTFCGFGQRHFGRAHERFCAADKTDAKVKQIISARGFCQKVKLASSDKTEKD